MKGLPGDLQPLTLQAARVAAGSLHTAPGEGLLGGQRVIACNRENDLGNELASRYANDLSNKLMSTGLKCA